MSRDSKQKESLMMFGEIEMIVGQALSIVAVVLGFVSAILGLLRAKRTKRSKEF